MSNPYAVVRQFEQELCKYTGALYAVTTTSCTMALLLALKWHHRDTSLPAEITIPNRTYISVPQSIIHAGFWPRFESRWWVGQYQLQPTPVWDSAKRFTSAMYKPGNFECVSFHWSKILGIGQGGAILHDDAEADKWFRRMRFDGRTEGKEPKLDDIHEIGYHCYMSPRDAADGLSRLVVLPLNNAYQGLDDYPDLSKMAVFQ